MSENTATTIADEVKGVVERAVDPKLLNSARDAALGTKSITRWESDETIGGDYRPNGLRVLIQVHVLVEVVR